MIRWVWAVIDRPVERHDLAGTFWTTVTGTRLSAPHGSVDASHATLVPPTGASCLKLRGVVDAGGAHVDLAVDDIGTMADRSRRLGATVVAAGAARTVMRSPHGLAFCLLPWRGEADRPGVVQSGRATSRLDQVCVDVASDSYDSELGFWAALTGWELHRGASPERDLLKPVATMPIRILLQRLGDPRPTSAHLDLACSDIEAIRDWHERCGARVLRRWHRWIVMADPTGGVYCVTVRDPRTGALPAWAQRPTTGPAGPPT